MVSEVTSAGVTAMTPSPSAQASRPEGARSAAEARKSEAAPKVEASRQPEQGQPTENLKHSQKELDDAVRHLSERVQNIRRELRFNVDEDTGRTVVKVIDSQNNEVIRQIPAEEVLRFAQRLREMDQEVTDQESQGLILRTHV